MAAGESTNRGRTVGRERDVAGSFLHYTNGEVLLWGQVVRWELEAFTLCAGPGDGLLLCPRSPTQMCVARARASVQPSMYG